MTAVEKAKELYFKYYQQVADGSHPEYNAKQCALIAVDEIIKSNPHTNPFNTDVHSTMGYWQEVKHELNKSEL